MKNLRGSLKWLHPGMQVKRWIGMGFLGLLLFLIGAGVIIQTHAGGKPLAVRLAEWVIESVHIGLRPGTLGLVLTMVGAGVCFFAFGKLLQSLMSAVDPDVAPGGLADVVYARRKLSRGRRIVVIGGGTGLSTMLRGLKRYSSNITAIVTVADDGGSSGKLKKQLNILPPGDIRNCLVALADAEPQMMELFQYRFRNNVAPVSAVVASSDFVHAKPSVGAMTGQVSRTEAGAGVSTAINNGTASSTNGAASSGNGAAVNSATAQPINSGGYGEGLRDHAFGNLLIAAMCAINDGDFERGIQETSRVLNIRGRVLPSTVSHVHLRGDMEDGSTIDGESNIASSPLGIKRIHLVPNDACPADDVIEAILRADVIVLGPGSVFTSVIPNLLVREIPEAIHRSRAKKVYVCNVMTQPGETDGFSAYDHVRTIENHAGTRVFDYVLVNTGQPETSLLDKYRRTGAVLVEPDTDRIKASHYRPITGNFINETDVVRHDAGLLAEAIMRLVD